MINKKKIFNFNIFAIRIIYISIFIIISVIVAISNPEALYISFVVTIILAILTLYMCVKEVKNRTDRISEISESVDNVLKTNLKELNVPMAIVDNDMNIVWQNNLAKHIMPREYIVDTAVNLDSKLKSNENAVFSSDIGNGQIYLAMGNYIKFSKYDALLITYINRTEEEELKNTLEETKITVGMIVVDNYEETMQGLSEIKKAEISSKIANEIEKWVVSCNGVLTVIAKDKFIAFIEKKYLDEMEKNQFEILEKIKNVTDETKLPITISIGFSHNETTLQERYKSSSSALDIALGRGGDQVVVKKDKKYNFYGGTNIELEKTSRVRARTVSQALREIMLKVDKVYIMGHKNSDIDCIGAAVGIFRMANMLGKEANIIIDSKYNSSSRAVIDKLRTLPIYENAFLTGNDIKKIDYQNTLLVIVDTHKKSYVAYQEVYEQFEKVVVIDHHRRGPEFIDNALLTYHEIYASSACELVTEILMYLDNIELSSTEAESIYAGIVVDTKNFMFKTGVRTFEVAAYLKRFGIDVTQVKQLFQSDLETYTTKVNIVKNAEIIRGQIAISVADEEHIDDLPIIAAQAADELLSISGVYASFVLCKVDNVIMISGRSMGDINVQSILEKIGGGGHLTFAGAQIAGVTIEEAKETLIKSIEEYFGNK